MPDVEACAAPPNNPEMMVAGSPNAGAIAFMIGLTTGLRNPAIPLNTSDILVNTNPPATLVGSCITSAIGLVMLGSPESLLASLPDSFKESAIGLFLLSGTTASPGFNVVVVGLSYIPPAANFFLDTTPPSDSFVAGKRGVKPDCPNIPPFSPAPFAAHGVLEFIGCGPMGDENCCLPPLLPPFFLPMKFLKRPLIPFMMPPMTPPPFSSSFSTSE